MRLIRAYISALTFVIALGCGTAPVRPVVDPPPVLVAGVGITLQPPLGGVSIDIGPAKAVTDERGVAFVQIPSGDTFVQVHVPDGFLPDAGGRYALVEGDRNCATWPNCELVIRLDRIRPPMPTIPFAGRITRDGKVFRDASGQPWTWRFATEFLLLNDILDGKDVAPVLDELTLLGANGVRVIGMATNIPRIERGQRAFEPRNYGDQYFAGLSTLATMLRDRGLYLEFTALADAQEVMPDPATQRVFVLRVAEVLSTFDNTFLEHCNEPFKNGCGAELGMGRAPGRVLQSSGNYDIREAADRWVLDAVFDYVTAHPPRDDEWPRKAHDSQDIRDGFENLGKSFAGAQVPVVLDEPIGAADAAIPGRRASDPDLFRQFGAACALFGAGCTFHSNAGVATHLLGDAQHRAAKGFYDGISAVASAAQGWRYNRGGLTGMPIAHSDDLALRTFAKLDGNVAYVVVIGHKPGWRLVEENGYHCTALVPEGDVLRCER